MNKSFFPEILRVRNPLKISPKNLSGNYCLKFPDTVFLKDAEARKRGQMSAKERNGSLQKGSKERNTAKGARKRKRAVLHKNCKQPGLKKQGCIDCSSNHFTSVTVCSWNGSSGLGFRFRRCLWRKGFQCSLRVRFLENGSDGSGFENGFRKTVPTVPVSSSGSVLEPSCYLLTVQKLDV